MGDFNGKVGLGKEDDIVGPFGLGLRNENGQSVGDFCRTHELFATNTWFQQNDTARHSWISPNKKTKNQIDYILMDKRFRNGVRNCKVRQDAECGSDHNPVIATVRIKLKRVQTRKAAAKWNLTKLEDEAYKFEF